MTLQELYKQRQTILTDVKTLLEGESVTVDQEEAAEKKLAEVADLDKKIATRESLKEAEAKAKAPVEGAVIPQVSMSEKPVEEAEIQKGLDVHGGQMLDVLKKTAETSYKKAFWAMTRGQADREDLKTLNSVNAELKTFNTGLGTDGGYLIPVDMIMEIIQQQRGPTGVRSLARVIPTALNEVIIPRQSAPIADMIQWTGELGTTTVDNSLKALEQKSIKVHEGTTSVEWSLSMAEDSTLIAGFINQRLGDALTIGQEFAFVSGNGVARPFGLLDNVGGANRIASTNIGNPFTADGIMDLLHAVPAQYRNNLTFLLNGNDVWGAVSKLKDSDGRFVGWVDSIDLTGLGQPRGNRILGYNAVMSAAMPGLGTGNNVMVCGDFSGYAIVERLAVEYRPWADTPATLNRGVTGATLRFRVGGDVLEPWKFRVGVQS